MQQKTALFLSAVMSVFILALVAGVMSFTRQPLADQSESYSVADVTQLLAEQEAAYSQVISDANQQIAQAQAVIDTNQSDSQSAVAPVDAIAPDAAQDIASGAAFGQSPKAAPELVNFEGTEAYEVSFQAGNIYVDALTGEIIHNGSIAIVPADISSERARQLATAYMGKNDVYKVEQTDLNGEQVFRVKFENGDAVFVSLKGDLRLVRLAVTAQNSNAPANGASAYAENEGDHEEHEEDDD